MQHTQNTKINPQLGMRQYGPFRPISMSIFKLQIQPIADTWGQYLVLL